MKKVFLVILVVCSYSGFSQKTERSNLDSKIITFKKIETPPLLHECSLETTTELKRKCVDTKLRKLVKDNFNLSLLTCLEKEYIVNQETGRREEMCSSRLSPGKKKIKIQFVINKTGETEQINVAAPHPKLQKEGIRIAKMIPKMIPGKNKGKPIAVSYSLPFSFNVK